LRLPRPIAETVRGGDVGALSCEKHIGVESPRILRTASTGERNLVLKRIALMELRLARRR
jgi:hypothetical protein